MFRPDNKTFRWKVIYYHLTEHETMRYCCKFEDINCSIRLSHYVTGPRSEYDVCSHVDRNFGNRNQNRAQSCEPKHFDLYLSIVAIL